MRFFKMQEAFSLFMIDVFLTRPVKGKPSNKKIERHENCGKGENCPKNGENSTFLLFPISHQEMSYSIL